MQLESSVILFDDNKVEDRFAELQITADGITSEVSRKVGNDEVISRINQSAEGVQIQANKVNIEGAAIFSSGRLSQSSLNNAYDAKGAATGAVDNLKSDLSSSSGTTVINGGHIETGTLSAGAVNANSGVFDTANIPDLNANKITAGTITDSSGNNSWNLTSGQFITRQGTIADMTINSNGLTYDHTSILSARELFRIYMGALQVRTINDILGHTGIDVDGSLGIQFYYDETAPSDPWNGMTKQGSLYPLANGFRINAENGGSIWITDQDIEIHGEAYTYNGLHVLGSLSVLGHKSRVAKTDNYNDRLLYCYETPTPLFGDIGEAVLDEDGLCYVDIDDIFSETIAERVEYQVFLQKEGAGDCWIADKQARFFVIQGTPGLKVAWELKAKQRDYEINRLEQVGIDLDEYVKINDQDLLDNFITEQEELLYGYY